MTHSQYMVPPPVPTNFAMPPPIPVSSEQVVTDLSEIPEPSEKRADGSNPLPEDLQEALDIIFPKEDDGESAKVAQNQQDPNAMIYSSMYGIGCVDYGHEYMDQPPPEITQTETEVDSQPGPDDLRMLGIDEGDTIL